MIIDQELVDKIVADRALHRDIDASFKMTFKKRELDLPWIPKDHYLTFEELLWHNRPLTEFDR